MRPVVLDELIVGFRGCFEILSEKVVDEHLRDPTEIQSPEWREVGSATWRKCRHLQITKHSIFFSNSVRIFFKKYNQKFFSHTTPSLGGGCASFLGGASFLGVFFPGGDLKYIFLLLEGVSFLGGVPPSLGVPPSWGVSFLGVPPSWGVSFLGTSFLGGLLGGGIPHSGRSPWQGVSFLWGSLSLGGLLLGGSPWQTPPLWKESHTAVKTLPWPQLRCGR